MRDQVQDEGRILVRTPANLDTKRSANDVGEVDLANKPIRVDDIARRPGTPRVPDKKQRVGPRRRVVDAVLRVAQLVGNGQVGDEVGDLEEPRQVLIQAEACFARGCVGARLSCDVEAVDGVARLEVDDDVGAVLFVRLVGLLADGEVDGANWDRGTGCKLALLQGLIEIVISGV